MASIGRFALSLASGCQDTTLALANFNLDFAMIRLEAPLEYQGLGALLSKKRKHEAEEGSVHATARRLGALFADDMPLIPNLTRAYGLRASEIAEDPSFNPIGSTADGPLAGHVGADGTSIWAAATSGRGALQVHLLACLLARMWSAPEAVAIWSELVSARKAVLKESLNGVEFQAAALTASLIDVTRDRLAEWDASARSWLRTADKAKLVQQKQLMLIVDNIGLQIPSHPQVYDSVLDVWIKAMTTVEKLISGVAQRIEDPEVLVGLSAWHIYPDMAFLGRETTVVKQNDKVVQMGGLVTVGMQSTNPEKDRGISWTMPLAQLQYYGKPALLKRAIGEESIRVSFDGIVQVAIGSLISTWARHADDFESVCHFLTATWESLSRSVPNGSVSFGWHELFSQQASAYLQAKTIERKNILRLVNLGRRRFSEFIVPEPDLAPAYGLCSIKNFLPSLKPEGQIKAIREMASKYDLGIDLRGAIMVCQRQDSTVEYASVFPYRMSNGIELHRRWTSPITVLDLAEADDSGQLQYISGLQDIELWPIDDKYLFDSRATVQRSIDLMANTGELCGLLSGIAITEDKNGSTSGQFIEGQIRWNKQRGSLNMPYLEKIAAKHESTMQLRQILRVWKLAANPHQYEDVAYAPLFDTGSLMVYQPAAMWSDKKIILPLDYLTDCINSGNLDERLSNFFSLPGLRDRRATWSRERTTDTYQDFQRNSLLVRSLVALYRASLVYQKLPLADVDLAVASKPLSDAKWARVTGQSALTISRPEAFACIAMFDTGHVNLQPSDFTDVMAISSGNTLYVSEMLLNDPCQCLTDFGIRCLVGNIGRPGVALLMSPRDPILLEPGLETWDMVNHEEFDGKIEDNFRGTSLQLSLTGYDQVVNVPNSHGRRHKEVFYVEAVVSAHECGKWVGDIDILSLYRDSTGVLSDFGNAVMRGMKEGSRTEKALPISCSHTEREKKDSSKCGRLTCIDNWSEFLDPPPNTAIIRASGNWIARLALAAAIRSRGDPVLFASGRICWRCVRETAQFFNINPAQMLILC